jgi:hypothetical protein
MKVSGQHQAPAALYLRYPLDRRLGGPLDTEDRVKILFLCRGSNPGRPVCSQTLYLLSYPRSSLRKNIVYIHFCQFSSLHLNFKIVKIICLLNRVVLGIWLNYTPHRSLHLKPYWFKTMLAMLIGGGLDEDVLFNKLISPSASNIWLI